LGAGQALGEAPDAVVCVQSQPQVGEAQGLSAGFIGHREVALGPLQHDVGGEPELELQPNAARLLERIAADLRDHKVGKLRVEGHTDSIGSDAYNLKLSERRAQAVRDYVVSQGIDAARISVKGWGKTKPVASNKTEAGRAENRRVEIIAE